MLITRNSPPLVLTVEVLGQEIDGGDFVLTQVYVLNNASCDPYDSQGVSCSGYIYERQNLSTGDVSMLVCPLDSPTVSKGCGLGVTYYSYTILQLFVLAAY